MEFEFLSASLINLAVNLSYTIISLIVGVYALLWVDKRLLKGVEIEEEMKKGNVAVSIFASALLIFVAIIVSAGLKA